MDGFLLYWLIFWGLIVVACLINLLAGGRDQTIEEYLEEKWSDLR